MARKKGGHGGGGHGWFVTFADLMGLLMSFFVMLVAFSTQDQAKMKLVAGSMRDAFGMQRENRFASMIEMNGTPTKPFLKNAKFLPPEEGTDQAGPLVGEKRDEGLDLATNDRTFGLAAATLRQAIADLPEIAELSKNLIVHENKDGLDVSLVDQTGRSMFPDGSVEPYPYVRDALRKLTPALKKLSNRIEITGHTAAPPSGVQPDVSPWELSVGRAASIRKILVEAGLPQDRFMAIAGKADNDPLFPDNPQLPANRRVELLLIREAPPLPAGRKL
ncbi:MAG: flagellar motor protein MotB [Beijerinckiaceae bacterium]|jgi:chemotaxis protein MotB|nr:flagellar motor protein MotB [Beijerinckiaceae bacterium]